MEKKLKILYKLILCFFFFLIYGKIKKNEKNLINYSKINSYNFKKKKYKVYEISNGRVYTNNVDQCAYISNNFLLSEPSYQYFQSRNQKIDRNEVLKFGTPKILKKINSRLFSLLSGGAANNNYGHWFWDVLPKIYLIKKFYKITKKDFFLVPSLKYIYQKKTLNYLNINKYQLISAENYKHIGAKKLICTSHVSNHHPEKIPFWSLNYIRKTFLKKKFFFPKKYENLIYLDRDEFKHLNKNYLIKYKNLRTLVNEDEVKKFLLYKGFQIIKPQTIDFFKQINLFYNSKVIISISGAGLANIVFCRKKVKILEISPKNFGNEFLFISRKLKLKHVKIKLKTLYKSNIIQNGLMYLKIDKLDKVLKKIL